MEEIIRLMEKIKNNLSIIIGFIIILGIIIFPLSAMFYTSEYDKLSRSENPKGFSYVGVNRYYEIVSNCYDKVDVRDYGIPLGSKFIYFDGSYLYFSYHDSHKRIMVYSFNPIQKTSKEVSSYSLSSMTTLYSSATDLYGVYMSKPGVFDYYGYFINSYTAYNMSYRVSLDASGNVINHDYRTISSTLDKHFKYASEKGMKHYWSEDTLVEELSFENCGISDGAKSRRVFDENTTDALWMYLKNEQKVSYTDMRKFAPNKRGEAVAEIVRKDEYIYFVSSYEDGQSYFLINNGKEQLSKVFVV